MVWLKAETRPSYHCSPSERRAKTTDPGHARGREDAAAAPTPGHTAQKFGFRLESDPRETLPTFRKGRVSGTRDEDEDGPEEAEKTESSATRDQGFEGESQP